LLSYIDQEKLGKLKEEKQETLIKRIKDRLSEFARR